MQEKFATYLENNYQEVGLSLQCCPVKVPHRFCSPLEFDGPFATNESVHAPVVPMVVTNLVKSSLSWQMSVLGGVTVKAHEPEVV